MHSDPTISGDADGSLYLNQGGSSYPAHDWWQAAGLLRGTDLDRLRHSLYNNPVEPCHVIWEINLTDARELAAPVVHPNGAFAGNTARPEEQITFLRVFHAVELLLNAFPELPWQRPQPAPAVAIVEPAEVPVKKTRAPRKKKVIAEQFELPGVFGKGEELRVIKAANKRLLLERFLEVVEFVIREQLLPDAAAPWPWQERELAVRLEACKKPHLKAVLEQYDDLGILTTDPEELELVKARLRLGKARAGLVVGCGAAEDQWHA